MRALVGLLAVAVLGSCSIATIDRVPNKAPPPANCTTSQRAPFVDVALAAAGLVTTAIAGFITADSSEDGASTATLAITAGGGLGVIVFGGSAAYGFAMVRRCRGD